MEQTALWFYCLSNCLCSTVAVPLLLQLYVLQYSRQFCFMVLLSLELSQFYGLCTTAATTVSVLQQSGQLYGFTMSRTVSVLLSLYHCRHNCLCSTIERTTLWFYYISNCLCSTVSVPLPLQLSLFYSRADSFMVLHYLELSQFYCLSTTVATTVSVVQDSGQLYGSTISRTVSVPLSLRLSFLP